MTTTQSTAAERMEAARDFPNNTCGASRHAQIIAEALLSREPYPMLTEEPEHCGESIAATVTALWELRASIAAPRAQGVAGFDDGEGWEALAWALCAEENGEDACNELIWEGGLVPEPWGDRWLKYEGAAKDMIAKVRKYAAPSAPAAPAQEPLFYSVTFDGRHVGNFYETRKEAEQHKSARDASHPGAARTVVPLYAAPLPQAPAASADDSPLARTVQRDVEAL